MDMPTPLVRRPLDEAVAIRENASMVRQSNVLIQQSHFNLGATESKIWLYIVQQIKPTDTSLGEMQFRILDFCRIAGIDPDSGGSYRTVRQALKRIADSSVFIKDIRGDEILVRWLSSLKLSNRRGVATIEISKEMQPYLLALHEHYTSLPLVYAARLRSRYGIRLYELLKSYTNFHAPLRVELSELRKMLELKDDYSWGQIHRNVIDKAVGDINKFTDIEVSYDAIKQGSNVEAIIFYTEDISLEEKDKRMAIVEKDMGPSFSAHYTSPIEAIEYDEIFEPNQSNQSVADEDMDISDVVDEDEELLDGKNDNQVLKYADGASKPAARAELLIRLHPDKVLSAHDAEEQAAFDLVLRTMAGLCNRHTSSDIIVDGGNKTVIDNLNKIISQQKFDVFFGLMMDKYAHIFDGRDPVKNPIAYISKSLMNDIENADIVLRNAAAQRDPCKPQNIPVTRQEYGPTGILAMDRKIRLKRRD